MEESERRGWWLRRGSQPRARPPLRSVLMALVLVTLLPTVVLSAGLMIWQWREQRDETQRHLAETVNAIAQTVDAEVEGNLKRLQLLATSPMLPGDLAAFEEAARFALAASGDWSHVALIDLSGQQLLNTAAVAGAPLPSSKGRGYFQQVLQTRAPVVTDVMINQVNGQATVRVAQPVIRDGELLYVLTADLNLAVFDALLSARVVREGGIGSVVDPQQRFIARSREPSRFRGNEVIVDIRDSIRTYSSGFMRARVYDGPDVFTAWTTAPATGWTITLGVPVATVEAALRRSLVSLAGAGLALLFITGLGALLWARRVSSSISSASEAAVALAERRPLPPIESAVREVEDLAAALARTHELLRSQEEERDRLLDSEQTARTLAERESRSKDEFLAMLGHELRNPLAAISASLALLERNGDDAMQRRARDMVRRQTRTLTRLVDDLLDVARVAAGKVKILKSRVRLDEIVRQAAEALFAQERSHDVSIEAAPVWVEGDPTRLEQITTNLLGNARKFTPAGGRIAVKVGPADGEALLEVRDDGSGIAPELLPHVFELFVQGAQSIDRRAGGLGIGLTLVQHLVTLHGGSISAASEGLGRGATLVIRLPRAEAAELPAARPTSNGERSSRPRRVAVVEDNEDARLSLVSLLQSWGHEVRSAADGPEGLALIGDMVPDVAIVDIGLPGLDGYGVARAVRESARNGGEALALKLVALTGYGTADDRSRSAAAGFDLHLVKPVDPDALSRLLDDGAP